jgi:pimeloyl-ACP methyl ester carboxylesterase
LCAWALPYAQAQGSARFAIAPTSSPAPLAVSGCPNNGGLLDSVSVPVNQPLDLYIQIGSPAPSGGASFRLSSDDAALVAAGDRLQGFLPVVTVPEGQYVSNAFRVFGIKVGATRLRATPLTSGYLGFAVPITAWDLNPGAPDNTKFVDANPPANHCRVDAASTTFSRDATKVASCGKNVEGVAADGLSRLLLRAGAGITGTACFEIVSTSTDDQGSLDTAVQAVSAASNGLKYAPSYYTAPANYGGNGEHREIEVEVSYTPDVGNGNTSRARYKTSIVRPPVVLVHGLWGSRSSFSEWTNYQPEGAYRTILAADYAGTNASHFSANRTVLERYVDQALTLARRRFAASRVDLVAHSMGGIVSRLHIGAAGFKSPENLNEGDVRRLLTLVTPHYGSSFANLIVALHAANAADTDRVVRDVVSGRAGGGAVCDLAENSTGLALPELAAGTALKAQAYTATGGPPGSQTSPALFFGGAYGRANFEGALTERRCSKTVLGICTERLGPYIFPQATVDAFRFRQANDTVVPRTSQRGGLSSVGANFPTVIHSGGSGLGGLISVSGMTNTRAVATAAFALLDGPDAGFAGGFGPVPSTGSGKPRTVPGRGAALDQADYAAQCGTGGPLASIASPGGAAAAGQIGIASPADGATFVAGSTLPIVGQLATGFEPEELGFTLGAGIGHVDATGRSDRLFQLDYALPTDLAGQVTITPTARDPDGHLIEGAPVTVNVLPGGALDKLAFVQAAYQLSPGAEPQPLSLGAHFAGQPARVVTDVTRMGAAFASSDPSVVAVDGSGNLSAVGTGLASVKGTFGGRDAYASVVVQDPALPLPPQELTGQFAIVASGFRLNRTTGFYVQTLTLTNQSQGPLPAPLYLTVNWLPANVRLVGAPVGQTVNIPAPQTPYLGLQLPGPSLAPGESLSLQLQFLNPARVRISYQPKVFWTDGQP